MLDDKFDIWNKKSFGGEKIKVISGGFFWMIYQIFNRLVSRVKIGKLNNKKKKKMWRVIFPVWKIRIEKVYKTIILLNIFM